MPRYAYLLLPLIGGAMIAAQAPVNARLRVVLGSPVGARWSRLPWAPSCCSARWWSRVTPAPRALGAGPWWAYLGGAFGAVFVFATLVASPRLGVTTTFVAVIVGQVALAALIHRFGWLGAEAVPFSWERLAALALMCASLVLLLRSSQGPGETAPLRGAAARVRHRVDAHRHGPPPRPCSASLAESATNHASRAK